MNKVIEYVRESKEELLHKVSWPTWSELQNSALIVVIATSMIAVLIFFMDYVFGNVINEYYKLF